MKRFPEPRVRRTEGYDDDDPIGLRIIREELPLHWLLSELLFHTVMLCADVYEKVSARILLDAALSAPRGANRKAAMEADTFFNRTYGVSYDKNEVILGEFLDNASEEEKAAWERMDSVEDADSYLIARNKRLPHYGVLLEGGNFFIGDYRHLSKELRAVTNFAFSGFLFHALNSPHFASLCKDKSLNASTMTFEQKLDTDLDHEALYNRLMIQLGHA